jgi:hypothetical protein
MEFDGYAALVLPDDIRIDEPLKAKLDAYLAAGGKLILSGESGLWKDRAHFAFDLGAEYDGLSEYHPAETESNRGHDYILPIPKLQASFVDRPQIMYERSHRIRVTKGQSLGQIYQPYFSRTWEHFCSHQHTPNQESPSGFDCGVQHGSILYFSHPVFRHYRAYGGVAYREFVVRAIRDFLGDALRLSTTLPSTARVTLTKQAADSRHILHLLYAPTISRGGAMQLSGGNVSAGRSIEVIEDLPELHDVQVELSRLSSVKSVRTVPAGEEVAFEIKDGKLLIPAPAFSCHQMFEIVS